MSRLIRVAAFAALSAGVSTVFLAARPAVADDKAEAKPAAAAPIAAEEGFTYLFNGKNLDGWTYGKVRKGTPAVGPATAPAAPGADAKGAPTAVTPPAVKESENKAGVGYQVKDGVIYSTKDDGGNLYSEKEYGDFVLRFDFKLTENANNGIGIRAPLAGDSAYVGMEIQVLDDSGPAYTKIKPAQHHGSVYGVVAAKQGSQKPVGQWNTEEIVAHGTKIKVTVNDMVIVDTDLADVKDEAVLKAHPGLKNPKGHIGFLGHGAQVEFRNLRIKEL